VSRRMTLLAGSALAAAVAGGVADCSSGTASPASATSHTTAAPTAVPTAVPTIEPTSTATSAFPNAGLSSGQLQAAFQAAVAAGTAAHVVGSVAQNGATYSLDLHLNRDGSTEGSISQGGASAPVKAVGGVTYVQLTPAFLKRAAALDPAITPGVITAAQDKWVTSQSSIGRSLAAGLSSLTSYDAFMAMIETGSPSGSVSAPPRSTTASALPSAGTLQLDELTADGTTTYDGGTVAVYRGAGGSTAYFAATGPAYLEKTTANGADAGTLGFTWNRPVAVSAPPSSDIFDG
jgi:hypothetical protein